ncbi:hypothetical protein HZA96_02105 [Candidatus Woesearchaeota archaeon]|nr:hypothetical protein [Candidatus Woesearchaeota archaeon]
MSWEYKTVHPQQVMFKGIFDLDELQKVVRDWFIFRDYEFHERMYKTKATPRGKETELLWFGFRKVNNFMMYWVDIHFHFWDLNIIEVVKDGQKKKLYKGRLYVRLMFRLEFDYNNTYDYSKIKRAIRHFLLWYVMYRKFSSLWEDKLRFKCYDLMNIIKTTLDMQTKGNEHADVW